ncbi:hypothetical protein GA0070624_5515 [Micromonospora rhizosphaerae]|uniref:Uncharacterized protein n=1 Tax=Micromonospora rhizosphaerae TaxID=568872 RepID=A0A1C6T3A0_9ACTN|nr:hypothetical protein [Micromonospora rhizosphaerae]SCL36300.1 hypothetical protein GA0070624_5515 [Micromonospora rhizosphaerae]
MDDLTKLHSAVTDFADQHTMVVVPAVPTHDLGPEVQLEPDVLDLPGFLNVAHQLGARALYVQTETFNPDPDEVTDPPARLLKHRGKPCTIEVAFVASGVVHFWEHTASWYTEWENLIESQASLVDADDEPRWLSEDDRERLAAPAVGALLAMPEFRAAKPGGARQRFAKSHLPADLHERVHWDAVRTACDRAEELTQQRYAEVDERYDELAAQLLKDPAYQRAGSVGVRKQAAEHFLTAWADGFVPPSVVRDELYARAQRLAKAAARPPALY